MAHDDSTASESSPSARPRRERSTRYPGVNLEESLKLCESIDELAVDGLAAPAIAAALGYTNIKTNTFSARLSAARQFGLLSLSGDGYSLSPLARALIHPVDRAELPRLLRQALVKPPLYAELAERLAGKRAPEASILGNVLYHNHQIIASAKQVAAEAFLESAKFAGTLDGNQVFRLEGAAPATPPGTAAEAGAPPARPHAIAVTGPQRDRPRTSEVRLDLQLWDRDEGKTIRVRAPQSITAASFERLLQALRLLVRIEE